VRGSVDHVQCITEPARGRPITLPFKDAMVCAIHADDMAEVFARVMAAERPAHRIYNSGGTSISLGEIADIVRSFLPDARITFRNERGAKEENSTYLLDNNRLVSEFGIQYRPFRESVLQIINDVRRREGLPLGRSVLISGAVAAETATLLVPLGEHAERGIAVLCAVFILPDA
jgi:nucleoside-diphosphate-sugar epimerase